MRVLLILLLFPLYAFADEKMPRHVLAFWDSRVNQAVEESLVHRMLEMPLNHLGIDVLYYDIHTPLPDLSQRKDILGILLCFHEETKMKDPKAFIEWAVQAIHLGKKVVIMRNGGFYADLDGNYMPSSVSNRLLEQLGITHTQKYIDYPFGYKVLSASDKLYPAERNYPSILPSFYITKAFDPKACCYLKVGIPGQPDSEADLIVIHPHGAYVADYFANSYQFSTDPRMQQWFIDPFHFFELIFPREGLPIPDTTTLVGRRIFYSTLHGDNWNTKTAIEGQTKYCSEVLLENVILPNQDIPVTVGVVAADVDPSWEAKPQSQEIARKYFQLPQVEAASHTYSHPFAWDFFRTGTPDKELFYLHRYPSKTWQNSFLSWFRAKYYSTLNKAELKHLKEDPFSGYDTALTWKYATPRAYANEPFNLEREIKGSVSFLNGLAPTKKTIQTLIWSGDGRPWGRAISLCEEQHLTHIGGGFVQFDAEYPSLLFVYPLGRKPEGKIQIYSSANAENIYTHGWSNRFYGFQYLPETLKNTETPRRIKPILLYYHSYSGEFLSSLHAVLKNIEYIRSTHPIAIQTSRFCHLAEGFYSIEIEPLSSSSWKFHHRKGLQTIRFDHAHQVVDFPNSHGILGYKEYQGSLYVHLDPAIEEPILALGEGPPTPHLEESSWEIWDLKMSPSQISFSSRGFGTMAMTWKNVPIGTYRIGFGKAAQEKEIAVITETLQIEQELPFNQEIHITIDRL